MKFKDISLLKRKNFVILALVMMLGLIGYINYNLNKTSLLKTSSELENYEMKMMEESGVLREILEEDEYELTEEEGSPESTEESEEAPESTEESMNEETESTEEQKEEKDISLGETAASDKVEGEMDNAIIVDSRENSVIDVAQETNAQISAMITNQQMMKSNIYFIESKLERDKKRSEMVSYLDDIVNNEYTSEDLRSQALSMKMEVVTNSDKELLIENMVIAKGFSDVVVFMSGAGDSINVVVHSETLNEKEVAQIVDIVRRETDIPMDNIIIMNKK